LKPIKESSLDYVTPTFLLLGFQCNRPRDSRRFQSHLR